MLPSACDQHGSGFTRVCRPGAINMGSLRWGRTRLGLPFPLIRVVVDNPGREGGEGSGQGGGCDVLGPLPRRGARGRDAGLRRVHPLRRRAPALPHPPLLFLNDSSLLNEQ